MYSVGVIVKELLVRNKAFASNPIGKWSEIVGEEVASSFMPVKLKDGVLIIHAKDSIWKYHMEFYKDEILRKIDERSKGLVKKIIIKVGELPEPDCTINTRSHLLKKMEENKKKRKSRKIKKKTYELSERSKDFINSIKDPALKRIAKKLLPLCPPK